MQRILHIDSSAGGEGSLTRSIGSDLVARLADELGAEVVRRDLAEQAPDFVDADWVEANFTAPDERNDAQRARLAASDVLVDELRDAHLIVIGAPVYNFGIPAVLKAWVDMIGRVHRTFRYTSDGPVGLLEGKRAIIVTASGGTGIGSDIDFATPYLRHVLAFVGISDVTVVAAERGDADAARAEADALVQAERQNDDVA